MQQPHVKLKEIIWEVTDQCNQNCDYCGSKDSINKTPIVDEDIYAIVDNIASYPPEEINISGGNPLMLSPEIHEYIFDNIPAVCKIIVNPFNIMTADPSTRIETLALYDAVGLSVNEIAELNCADGQLNAGHWNKIKDKITIITNFNLSNIWSFKQIEEFVKRYGFIWQVQYTMYKGDNSLAVYQNEDADKYLRSLIEKSSAKIIKADNMNAGNCAAGMYSLGILANGDVVPCLSMRGWDTGDIKSYGNLLETDLKDVWESGFSVFRCREFKCCKDVTRCTKEPTTVKSISTNLLDLVKDTPVIIERTKIPNEPIVCMYGVFDTNNVYVYGVVDPWSKK